MVCSDLHDAGPARLSARGYGDGEGVELEPKLVDGVAVLGVNGENDTVGVPCLGRCSCGRSSWAMGACSTASTNCSGGAVGDTCAGDTEQPDDHLRAERVSIVHLRSWIGLALDIARDGNPSVLRRLAAGGGNHAGL